MDLDSSSDLERRTFPRTRMSVLCKLWLDDEVSSPDTVGEPLCGLTMDVSRDGFSAWLDHAPAEGSRCMVRFFNTRERVQSEVGSAVVRRVVSCGAGFMAGIELEAILDEINVPAADWYSLEAGTRVLVVDDNSDVCSMIKHFLEGRGFHVDTAANGDEALVWMQANPPDVLLLDLKLPQMDGNEVLRSMRARGINVGIVYTISGYADAAMAQECLDLGARDHIAKPFNLKELDWSIRFALGSVR